METMANKRGVRCHAAGSSRKTEDERMEGLRDGYVDEWMDWWIYELDEWMNEWLKGWSKV